MVINKLSRTLVDTLWGLQNTNHIIGPVGWLHKYILVSNAWGIYSITSSKLSTEYYVARVVVTLEYVT